MLTGRFMLQALIRRGWLLPLFALPLALGAWLLAPRSVPVRWTAEARVLLNAPPPQVRLPDPHAVWYEPQTARRAAALLVEALKRKPEEAAAFADLLARTVRVEVRQEAVKILCEAEDDVVAAIHASVFARAAADEALERRDLALKNALAEATRRAQEALLKADAVPVEFPGSEGERRLSALNTAALEIERQIEVVRAQEDRTLARIRLLEGDEHRLRELLPTGPEEDGLKSPVLERIRSEINLVRTEMALQGLDRAPESPVARARLARLSELEQALRLELHRARSQTIVALRESLTERETELRTLDERRLRKSLEIRDVADDAQISALKRTESSTLRREAGAREEERQRLAGILESKPLPPLVPGPPAGDPVRSGGRRGGFRFIWIAVGVGLVLGFSTACLWEGLIGRVTSGRDVRRLLDLPCLAVLERATEPMVIRAGQGPAMESYGMAATLLRAYLDESGFKVILVSSATSGEGKSTVAANLSSMLARKGMKVALIDADLRRPCQHELFGVDNSQGLSGVLSGATFDAELTAGATEIPTLRLMPSGPTQDILQDGLESSHFEELLKALREQHEVIIIDGPPLTGASDALALARLADTVLFVVRAGPTDLGRLNWARQLLANLHADIAGAVITMAARSDVRRYTPAA